MAKEVKALEKVRDEYLLTNALGRVSVSAYYEYGPMLAEWIAKRPMARTMVRVALYPILGLSKWCVGITLVSKPTKVKDNWVAEENG